MPYVLLMEAESSRGPAVTIAMPAQSRANRPLKFGTVSSQLVASMLDLRTDVYADDKRELMWDLATAMNGELRRLVAAGCR